MNKEQPIHNYNKGITLKDLEEVVKRIQESQKHNEEELEAREKQNLENIAHLSKKVQRRNSLNTPMKVTKLRLKL